MRTLLLIAMFLLCIEKSFGCLSEHSYRRLNQDGSMSGLISTSATVGDEVHIDSEASVCGKAWVEGHVKLLARTQISGNAYVRGSERYPTELNGSVQVYGSVRLLEGINATGRVSIYGSGTLSRSTLYDGARFCLPLEVTSKEIMGTTLCQAESNSISVIPVGYKLDKFNKISSDLILKMSSVLSSVKESKTQVSLNGTLLDDTFLVKGRGHVRIDSSVLVNGMNRFILLGETRLGETFSSDEIDIYAFSGEHEIAVNFGHDNVSSRLAKVSYEYDEKTFEGEAKFEGDTLILEGFPNLAETSVRLRIVSNQSYINNSYASLIELPSSLSTNMLPEPGKESNIFKADLSDLYISHPENVSALDKGGIQISPHETDEVVVSKLVRIPKHSKGFGFPVITKGSECGSTDVSSLIFDKNRVVTNESLKKEITGSSHLILKSEANEELRGMISVRLAPKNSSNCSEEDKAARLIELPNGIELSNVMLLNLANVSGVNAQVSNTNPLGGPITSNNYFDANYTAECPAAMGPSPSGSVIMRLPPEEIRYLSVNSFVENNSMRTIKKNRMWGTVDFPGGLIRGSGENQPGMYFTLSQNGQSIVSFGTLLASKCLRDEIQAAYTDLNNQKSTFNQDVSFYRPLVDFNFSSFLIGTIDYFSNVDIQLHAQFPNAPTISSLPISLPILVPFNVLPKYYNFDSIENFTNHRYGIDRTGGDKWINPLYQVALSELIVGKTFLKPWKYNDLTMLNGGNFGHKSHANGNIADFSYKYELKDFRTFGENDVRTFEHASVKEKWLDHLGGVYDFLTKLNTRYVEKIYTLIEFEPTKPNLKRSYKRNYYDQFLQGRCILPDSTCTNCDRRIVDFDATGVNKSILRNQIEHSNHLHAVMRGLDGDEIIETPRRTEAWPTNFRNDLILKVTKNETNGLYDFNFSLRSGTPANRYAGIRFYWRLQDQNSFANLDAILQYGNGIRTPPAPPTQTIDPRLMKAEKTVYLYFALLDIATGSCTDNATAGNEGFIAFNVDAIVTNKSFKEGEFELKKIPGKELFELILSKENYEI